MLSKEISKELFKSFITIAVFLFVAVPQVSANSIVDWLFPKKNWLEKIKADRIIPVGYIEDFYPFSYSTTTISPSGFSVEFTKMLVAKIDEKIRFRSIIPKFKIISNNSVYSSSYPEIRNKEIAIECNASLALSQKHPDVIFSKPFFISTIHVLSKRNQQVRNLQAMKNKLFLAQGNEFQEYLEQRLNNELKLNIGIVPTNSIQEAGIKLDQREAIGIIGDALRIFNIIYALPDPENYAVNAKSLGEIAYVCILLAQETELKEIVNSSIDEILKSEEYQKLYYRWFIQPAKDLNIALNYPMPNALQELIIKTNGNINPKLTGLDLLNK